MNIGINIEIEEDQGIKIVRLDGRLDAISSPLLEKKLIEQTEGDHSRIILDFGKVNYLSSAGIRLLLSMTKKLRGKSNGLHICSVDEEVMEIIKMAGFARIIQIFPTEQEAIQGFSEKKSLT